MSAVSDFMTQSSFWWGTGAGAILASTAGGILTYVSKHKSDTRTFENDKDKDDRQAAREQKSRNDAIVFEAASDYAKTASDLLLASVDEKGIFNAIRDWVVEGEGKIDPKAMEKLAFAQMQVGEMKRLGLSHAQLKLFASTPLMDAASRVYVAMQAMASHMTNAAAKQACFNAATIELNNFVNTFRDEQGLKRYEEAEAQAAMPGYQATLKAQVDAFQAEAAEMRRGATKRPPR